jgi:hypothetical protein
MADIPVWPEDPNAKSVASLIFAGILKKTKEN